MSMIMSRIWIGTTMVESERAGVLMVRGFGQFSLGTSVLFLALICITTILEAWIKRGDLVNIVKALLFYFWH